MNFRFAIVCLLSVSAVTVGCGGSSSDSAPGACGQAGTPASPGASGAGGQAGSSSQLDPICWVYEVLTLSDFKLTKGAGPSDTAELTVAMHNTSHQFIDYVAVELTCDEQGALVTAVSPPLWYFGILGQDAKPRGQNAQLNQLTVTIAPSATPGATIHCTAHVLVQSAPDCPNAATSSLAFDVSSP
jgi:hypothetical protein